MSTVTPELIMVEALRTFVGSVHGTLDDTTSQQPLPEDAAESLREAEWLLLYGSPLSTLPDPLLLVACHVSAVMIDRPMPPDAKSRDEREQARWEAAFRVKAERRRREAKLGRPLRDLDPWVRGALQLLPTSTASLLA
ncbi:hypothetical protein [Deinococcus sonorensis]|uniref:Uncharacterized protein n=1 Tax=Deinococcus sonorensis TaxID=309891 RepID=A0ABV8Y8B1_9DEIO